MIHISCEDLQFVGFWGGSEILVNNLRRNVARDVTMCEYGFDKNMIDYLLVE